MTDAMLTIAAFRRRNVKAQTKKGPDLLRNDHEIFTLGGSYKLLDDSVPLRTFDSGPHEIWIQEIGLVGQGSQVSSTMTHSLERRPVQSFSATYVPPALSITCFM